MYSKTTRSIRITVNPMYLEDQSAPAENHFVWAYHVRIENEGAERVQLRTRYWRITDSFGRVQEVRGPGVVGEQPVLEPGEAFEYTSGTPPPSRRCSTPPSAPAARRRRPIVCGTGWSRSASCAWWRWATTIWATSG